MKHVEIHTDGSCYYKTLVGGYCGIIVEDGNCIKEVVGSEHPTTISRMEVMAAIKILETLEEPCHVDLHSDSKYLVDNFNGMYVYQWESENFELVDGNKRPNEDLWRKMLALANTHNIRFHKVKGHSGHIWNERCDWLAGRERIKLEKELGFQ